MSHLLTWPLGPSTAVSGLGISSWVSSSGRGSGPFRNLRRLLGEGEESQSKKLRPVRPHKAGLEGLPPPPPASVLCSFPEAPQAFPVLPLGGCHSGCLSLSSLLPPALFSPALGIPSSWGVAERTLWWSTLIPFLAPGGPLPHSSKETPQILHGMYPRSQ